MIKQQLFQVCVEETETRELRVVGPAMLKEQCLKFRKAIERQIAAGREKSWSNPHLIRAN